MLKTLFERLQTLRKLDEDGGFGGSTGAEAQEVADPVSADDAGAEEQEVAEPADDEDDTETSSRTDADAAFAEMRRRAEAAERARDEAMEALGYFFDGDGEERLIQAQATAEQRSEEDVRAERARNSELSSLQAQVDLLTEQNRDYQARERMAHDLKEIQSIDPSVKRLEDLPDSFFDFIAANLSGKQAYFAAKALEQSEQVSSPAPTGKVSQAGEEKDFFTADEVRSMSPEEVHKNFEKIRRSQSRW